MARLFGVVLGRLMPGEPPGPRPQAAVPTLSLEALRAANLAAAATPGEPAPEETVLEAALDQAFGADGLGIICVTGDDQFQARVRHIREGLLPLALALSKLPDEAKAAIAEQGTQNVNNYSRGIDGNRSGLYFHPSTDNPGELLPNGVEPEPTFYTPNLWPDEDLPELRTEARAAAPFVVDVGRELVQAVDRRFRAAFPGYEAGTLVSLVRDSADCNHKCRLICYHEYDSEEQRVQQKAMWAPPHKDTGLLTGLVPGVFLDPLREGADAFLPGCPDPEVGLYVRDRRGAISKISAPPGSGECLFFQVGEAMQIVSGGLYHATEHCVKGPPRSQAGYVRSSLAVFFQPHAHEDLPLPGGVSLTDVAARANDGLFKMYLHYQPKDARGINFLSFCHRDGF